MNTKFYIGSTDNFNRRWRIHKKLLNKNKHHSKYLQNSWNKYGQDSFIFIEIEHTMNLIEREQIWLDFFKSYDPKYGYNVCPTAGSSKGFKHSDETKERIRNSIKQTNYRHSDETKKLMRIRNCKNQNPNPKNLLVMEYKQQNPTLSNNEIGRRFDMWGQSVGRIIKKHGLGPVS